jgi:hypothetical protein
VAPSRHSGIKGELGPDAPPRKHGARLRFGDAAADGLNRTAPANLGPLPFARHEPDQVTPLRPGESAHRLRRSGCWAGRRPSGEDARSAGTVVSPRPSQQRRGTRIVFLTIRRANYQYKEDWNSCKVSLSHAVYEPAIALKERFCSRWLTFHRESASPGGGSLLTAIASRGNSGWFRCPRATGAP